MSAICFIGEARLRGQGQHTWEFFEKGLDREHCYESYRKAIVHTFDIVPVYFPVAHSSRFVQCWVLLVRIVGRVLLAFRLLSFGSLRLWADRLGFFGLIKHRRKCDLLWLALFHNPAFFAEDDDVIAPVSQVRWISRVSEMLI